MRDFNKNNRSGGRKRPEKRAFDGEMFPAICDECGKKCEVPFKPSSDKPIYCSNCFRDKNDGFSDRKPERRNFRDNDFGEKQMFPAVCDECGKKCEVPFKPTSSKPIYCSDCFEKRDNGGSRDRDNSRGGSNNKELNEKLDALSLKLDRIILLLEDDKGE